MTESAPPPKRSRAPRAALGTPDLAAFFAALAPVRVGHGSYSQLDRYRDFRAVFFGSDAGRRVLAQIVNLCEGLPVLEADAESHARMAYRAGMRRVGQEIVRWMNAEPPVPQERTQAEKER